MKKMKLMVLLFIVVFALNACGKAGEEKGPTGTPGISNGSEDELSPTISLEPTKEPAAENQRDAGEVIDEIAAAVREAYGEQYIPSVQYDEVSMQEYFGIDSGLYDAYVAEGPMITVHIDTFVAVHATEGNVQAVEDALNGYKDSQINDAFQYPSNMYKIQASKVLTVDDYVFFITLGSIDNSDFTEDSQYIEVYAAQNQLAVDAIYNVLSK